MKSPFHSIALFLVVALCFGAGGYLHAGVINGGFETPNTLQYQEILAGDPALTGWTVGGQGVLLIDGSYSEPGVAFNPNSGLQALDITGIGNTSPLNSISQFVSTTPGALYDLSFWLGNAAGNLNYLLPSSVTLEIDDAFAGLFTNTDITNPNGVNWALQNYTFTATNASTKIEFINGVGNDSYVGLDDVSIQQVPEPTSMLLFATAGAAGLLLRRRRR
jgi:hypothetical protein